MNILAIDTSADETSAAVVTGRKVLSHVEYSQIVAHARWGGIVPSIAKRAHEERIDYVVESALKGMSLSSIDAIAVTYGPGLAIALEVGIRKAKELASAYHKKLIAVNHLEGHIYSCFCQNSRGNPQREFAFPFLVLLVSGGHTEFALFTDHLRYKRLGETRDDAAGEALDKAARLLGLGYPGGPIIERLSREVQNEDRYHFPRPLSHSKRIEFSFSGLKTSFYYFMQKMESSQRIRALRFLASSFQEAVIDSLIQKIDLAVEETSINNLIVAGGVSANRRLRYKARTLVKKKKGFVYFPPYSYLTGDNAAMIGVVASYKAQRGLFVTDPLLLERVPRLSLDDVFG